jgi:hypothetical protein
MSGIEKVGNLKLNNPSLEFKEKINHSLGKTFRDVMALEQTTNKFELKIQELEKVWNASEKESIKMMKNIPEEFKALFQAQIMVSKCNFQTEFSTKIADSASNAIKKLSQQNN